MTIGYTAVIDFVKIPSAWKNLECLSNGKTSNSVSDPSASFTVPKCLLSDFL